MGLTSSTPGRRGSTGGIYLSLALIGVTSVSGQIVFMRELFTHFYGNELSVGFMLAIWLLGSALGSGLLGIFFAGRIKKKVFCFGAVELFLGIFIPCAILFARVSGAFFGVAVGEIVSLPVFILSSLSVILPAALALGFLFVLGCKILPGQSGAAVIGGVYTAEAAGAVLGGFVTSLVLIRYLSALEIALFLSFLNFTACFFLMAGRPSRAEKAARYASACLAIALLCAVWFGIPGRVDTIFSDIRWDGFRVLKSRDTIYGRVTVAERAGQLNFFTNGLFVASSNDPLTSEEAVHFPMAYSRAGGKVLLIGGGPAGMLPEILKYPVRGVDYVELNPWIIYFSREFLDSADTGLDDERVRVMVEDGRYFLKNSGQLYDAVIMHLPNPYTARINRFYTREFFAEIKRSLAPGGVAGFGVTSSENYLSREQALFLKSLYLTAGSEFGSVKIVPGDTAHFILSGDAGDAPRPDAAFIAERLESLGIETFYVRDYYLRSKLSGERAAYLRSALRSAGRVTLNRDFHPISYFYDIVLWSTYLNFRLARPLLFLTPGRLLVAAVFLSFLFFFAFFALRKRKGFRARAALVALGTTGLSEISFQILVVLAFQIIYGYLYYKLGIIITAFMFGLAAGSLYVTRRLEKIRDHYGMFIKVQGLVCLYPLILLACFPIFSAASHSRLFSAAGANLFSFLPFIAGFIGGVQFPLAGRIYLGGGASSGKAAGLTYASDLTGSFVGAVLVSSFLIPVLGIPATCLLLVFLNGLSLVLLKEAARREV